jgi:hypothetical protein
MAHVDALLICRLAVCAFFCICLLQSGFDKIFDWKGNLDWLTGHFSKTIFRSQVPLMLGTVALIEVVAGFACGIAVVTLLLHLSLLIPLIALSLTLLNLLMLFAGQRISKDYPGAVTIASYFIVALFGVFLMQ